MASGSQHIESPPRPGVDVPITPRAGGSRRRFLGVAALGCLLGLDHLTVNARKRSGTRRKRRDRKQVTDSDLAPLACDPDATSGIVGDVRIGPMCPVMREDDPCPDQPYAANLLIQNQDGEEICATRSSDDGRFRVGLPPGDYLLVPEGGEPTPPYAAPMPVTVDPDAFTYVLVSYDSGIR
ncbi:MAG: hypothetical protein U0031_06420 [Thermomicrobiales bacterium]